MIDHTQLGLPVLHETPHELIVVKPAGMASQLTTDPRGVSLISRVHRACPPPLDPKLPHRLDRVARGLVLVALTPEAIAFHGQQIRAGNWGKHYLARVHAPPDRPLDALLGRHKAYLKRVRHRARVVRSGGKPSFLEIIAAHPAPGRPDQLHLLVQLLTGRFHQLRVMLAHLGAPLVDDPVYGADPARPRPRRVQQRRGPQNFYLEHLLLKYIPYGSPTPSVAYLRDDPDREPIAPALHSSIETLLK